MKVLIFGGNGFVGQRLYDYLKKQDLEVYRASRSENKDSIKLNIIHEEEFEKIDFLPDVIVNCASKIPEKNKTSKDPEFIKELFLTNVLGSVNIANWAVSNKVSKIINCSTLVVVNKPWPDPLVESFFAIPGGPHAGYCMSKLSQEQLMNECVAGSNTKLVHLRLSAVYGQGMPPEGIIFNLLNGLKNNEVISLTNASKNTFDFVNVIDICRSIHALTYTDIENGIINMASGNPISLLKLAELLRQIIRSSSQIVNHDTSSQESKANISIEKLKLLLANNYRAFVGIEEGLKDLIENHL